MHRLDRRPRVAGMAELLRAKRSDCNHTYSNFDSLDGSDRIIPLASGETARVDCILNRESLEEWRVFWLVLKLGAGSSYASCICGTRSNFQIDLKFKV